MTWARWPVSGVWSPSHHQSRPHNVKCRLTLVSLSSIAAEAVLIMYANTRIGCDGELDVAETFAKTPGEA
jgi:hypothetical protein